GESTSPSERWFGVADRTSFWRQVRGSGYAGPVPTPLAVVCDFDGTATLLDIGDEISKHFGGVEHWETETARFRRGELDTRGIIEAIYNKILASEEEVRAFAAATARLRPGFSDLVAACRARGAPFFLASGGLRQYIEAVLAANLSPEQRAHVRIVANEGLFGPGGLKVRFPTEDAARELGCTACGSCKRVAAAEARKAGAPHVIGAGAGPEEGGRAGAGPGESSAPEEAARPTAIGAAAQLSASARGGRELLLAAYLIRSGVRITAGGESTSGAGAPERRGVVLGGEL